jgi:predicted dehydrogenase
MINVALIGISGFARWYYRDLVRLAKEGTVRLAAAVVINQDEEAEKCQVLRSLGCELYTDYLEMLRVRKGRLDLCIIPTGIPLHALMTKAALAAGCHVLVEKPAAATLAEVDAMHRAAEEAGRFVAVGFQHIYTPEIARMKEALLGGTIGRIEVIKCQGLWPRPASYYQRNNWTGRLKVGQSWSLDAPFNNAFAHWLNLLCFLAGPRRDLSSHPVSVEAELYRTRPIESPDTACLRVETQEGIPLLLWVSHSSKRVNKDDTGPVMEVRGSTGSFIWTPEAITLRRNGEDAETWPVSGFEQFRQLVLDATIRKASGESAFVCGLDIARNQTLCANAAFESSAVHLIPSEYITECGEPGDSLRGIPGVEAIFVDSYRKECLWSEMGVSWAKPGKKVRISSCYEGIVAGTRLPCAAGEGA